MLTLNRIYHQDCFRFLRRIDDESIHLVAVDPPYFLNKGSWDQFRSQDDFLSFSKKWVDAIIPKLKEGGSLYVFNTPYNAAILLPYIEKRGVLFRNWITWDKRDGFSNTSKRYVPRQEAILFFTKGQEYTFNPNAVRIPYESSERIRHASKKGILKNGKRWFPNKKGRLVGDVWHFSSERHVSKVNGRVKKLPHATPKPLALMERIVAASSNPGDIVLDCFTGTGTTALAAKNLSRSYIGCDSSREYVSVARRRLKKGSF